MGEAATAVRILDVAEGLVQTRGYEAFSYADIADALRIRKASIHYHFPSKAELTRALAARYRTTFAERVAAIEAEHPDPTRRLMRYVRLYQEALKDGDHMCLPGMLASDAGTLPEPVRQEVSRFFEEQEAWLIALLAQGRQTGEFRYEGKAETAAAALVAGLEGAMLLARVRPNTGYFAGVALRLVSALTSGS
jgi:TetR/AcrR family transcriptional regulator, transcriptional repressor for nem operon